jgi:hypothetical protein
MRDAFDRARRSPDFEALMEFVPEVSIADSLVLIVFIAAGTAVGAWGLSVYGPKDATTRHLLMGALVTVGAVLCMAVGRALQRYLAAPLERHLALIRDEAVDHTFESRSRTNSRGVTTTSTTTHEHHSVLLELESGERQTHSVSDAFADEVVPGDIGVAYMKDGELLEFKRLLHASDDRLPAAER